MMRFGYGVAHFPTLRNEGYWYVDRTRHIRLLEDAFRTPVFLRPRRFGKSLWLSILASYYDVAQAKEFARLFGELEIGRNPTPRHNQYFILRWDFSRVSAFGNLQDIQRSLNNEINGSIEAFNAQYSAFLDHPIPLNEQDATRSFTSLLTEIHQQPYKLYLLIDEYDNFANEIAFSDTREAIDRFYALTQTDGLIKSLFKTIKGGVGTGVLDRVFITGVSPMLLADITSGFNIAQDITHLPEFQDLCGFNEDEIANALRQVITDCRMSEAQFSDALDTMRRFYDGYAFHKNAAHRLYNPTLALYFLHRFATACQYPDDMLDVNLSLDQAKLEYMARRAGGEQFLFDLAPEDGVIDVAHIINSFKMRDMMDMRADSLTYRSLLYYLGVLTLKGQLPNRKLRLKIPNLVTRQLYFEQIQRFTLPDGKTIDIMRDCVHLLHHKGDIKPLCRFIESKIFPIFSNRDSLHANEQTVKTLFMALLYEEFNYILRSEAELGHGYADLVLELRAEARKFELFDLLIEFKYVKLSDVKLDGAAVRAMPYDDLAALPAVQTTLMAASAQAQIYAARFRQMLGVGQKLRSFVVLALGFERLVWVEMTDVETGR